MRFLYGKQDMRTLERSQENCFLLTNGLGGYASLTAAYSANRHCHRQRGRGHEPAGAKKLRRDGEHSHERKD